MFSRYSKVHNFAIFFITRSGFLAKIWWSVCTPKSSRSVCDSIFRIDVGLCIYPLFVWSNWNFLHNSQWITLSTQSCLVLYYFFANFRHLLIMWLVVSTLSPHKLHLVSCCILSLLVLLWSVLTVFFCVAIRRDLVSLLRFSFLNHVHIFWCEMLPISRLKHPYIIW